MDDVALGVKVFSRYEKLERLLRSADDAHIETVYVADDGDPTPTEQRVYEYDYGFNLTVLDLEYDAGLGYGRSQIVEHADEPYLLIVDSDHEIPENVDVLYDQLSARPDIGGISGLFFEHGTIAGSCHDIYESGTVLERDIKTKKSLQTCAGFPLIEFEFLPNAALFRRECLTDYCWDPEYVIGFEHIDFYVGHKKETDWSFAVSPSVLVPHDRGGTPEYMKERNLPDKHRHSREYFLDKWGYDDIAWIDKFPPSYNHHEVVVNQLVLNRLPNWLQHRAIQALKYIKNGYV
jgi:glycosyltransferase involved in cell wall biosynthesis